MNPFVIFIIGLLVGWLVEWILDWLFWRKNAGRRVEEDADSHTRVADLEQEILSYKIQLASLQSEHDRMDEQVRADAANRAERSRRAAGTQIPRHDPLDEIPALSPSMVQQLSGAGISTFADLGDLSPQRLKQILEGYLLQPGSEVEIIRQARRKSGRLKKEDDLAVIVGIGPVIARMLNEAGIFTFAELSDLTARDLREIVGDRIQRIADEEKILDQARQLAEEQNRGEQAS